MTTSVFLSWSGGAAREFAERFSTWLQRTAAPVDVFYSPDISKGSRWSDQVMGRLASCDFGILVVTSENLHSEWMHFEAGALSQAIARTGSASAVAPLLIGVEPFELPTTLAQFRATRCQRDDLVRLVEAIRSIGPEPRWSRDLVERQVDAHWKTVREAYDAALVALQPSQARRAEAESSETDGDVLREVRRELGNLRQLNEYLVRRLTTFEEIMRVPTVHTARGSTPESTLDDDLGAIATYQFTSQEDVTQFHQWILDNYPSIDVEQSSSDLTVALLAYDEVEQYDRLRVRDAAVRDFGGERLD